MKIFLTQRPSKRRRNKKSYHRWFILFGLLFIISGMVLALREARILLIQEIVVEGQKRLAAQEVADTARANLREPVLRLIKPNMLLFPEKRLSKQLLEQFPRLAGVSFERSFIGRTLRIELVEREQVGIYCSAEPQGGVEQSIVILGCYLIDASGVIFAEAPQTEGGLILSLIDMAGKEIILGRQVVSSEDFQAIRVLWEMFRTDVGVSVSRLIRQDQNLLVVQTLEGWEALFDMSGDVKSQTVALRELLAKELPTQKRATVTTIDLRIPGKIYYR